MSRAWSRYMVLGPGTFGETKACHILVDMMNNNVISVFEKHRVLSFITDAIFKFNGIATIEESSVREHAMALMKEHYFSSIARMSYPDKFRSFLKNVINHHSRRALEGVV